VKRLHKIGIILLVAIFVAVSVGYIVTTQTSQNQTRSNKVVIAHAGGTCEAPTYVAIHKGFFADEGLDVELVQMGFDQLRVALDAGTVDAAQSNFQWFKTIEQGYNVKLTAGLHTGCIKAVTPVSSRINSIADLKGKTIGVEAIGGGPQIALSVKLREVGVNPLTEVEWKAYPAAQLEEAVNKGEIDAFISWDPFPTQAHDHCQDNGNSSYKYLLDTSADAPFSKSYCCFVAISGKVVTGDPEKAAAITRALLRGTEWVGEHPQEAAQIIVDNNYAGGDVSLHANLLSSYGWQPSINQAKANIQFYIAELKTQGILESSTNADDLYNKVFAEVISNYNGK